MPRSSAFLTLALFAVAPLAHADFVNGAFESPDVTPGTYLPVGNGDLPGWTITDSAIITNGFDGSGTGVTWHDTPSGHQYLYVNQSVGSETASQSVALTAGNQSLTFLQADFASQFNTPGGAVLVSVVRDSDGLSVVAPIEFDVDAYSDFVRQTLDFAAPTAGGYTFTFAGLGDGRSANIDAVSVQAVPEPATFAALGIAAAGLLRRRRKD